MTAPDNNEAHPPIRSYGRRKGRKLGARQQQLLDEVFPRVRIDLAQGLAGGAGSAASAAAGGSAPKANERGQAQRLADLFADRTAVSTDATAADAATEGDAASPPQTWLEIGFGGGEHLVWQAAHNPSINVIGCEPFIDGVVKVLRAIDEDGLRNIRLYEHDARDLLAWLPAASIDRAFILFPDPWPKKRQQKRRLVSPATLDLMARIMKRGAELRIGTDIADYARAILLAVTKHPEFDWPANGPDDWRIRPADWPETRYEQKAGREGRDCSYFSFRRI